MFDLIKTRIDYITNYDNILLKGINKGIEREALRCNLDSTLAVSNHPIVLGKPLTNKYITTDYSEALLELISPVFATTKQLIKYLNDAHYFVSNNIGDEYLWPASMPMQLPAENIIPIAQYGTSNRGKIKRIYREGLTNRYGKQMQMIAGLHYNVSFSEELWQCFATLAKKEQYKYINIDYFSLLRNFQRYAWLVIYLFGTSPIVHRDFIKENNTDFIKLDDKYIYHPYATSLRMSNYGYMNKAQQQIKVNYNNLNGYLKSLVTAIKTPYLPYTRIDVVKNGIYRQLNDSLLQIENEFYNIIRPKNSYHNGKTQLNSLYKYGVEYIEVRCLDTNLFNPIGIDQQTLNFMDIFLLFCTLKDSKDISTQEAEHNQKNLNTTSIMGRSPKLKLIKDNKDETLENWALQLLEAMIPIAEALDKANKTNIYNLSLMQQKEKIFDISLTPSAKVIAAVKKSTKSYNKFIIDLAAEHKKQLLSTQIDKKNKSLLVNASKQSIVEQQRLEAKTQVEFSDYIKNYFVQYNKLASYI